MIFWKSIFFVLFPSFLVSLPSNAEWLQTSTCTPDANGLCTEVFVDFESIVEDDNLRFFWALFNNDKRDKYNELSTKFYMVANCKNKKYKIQLAMGFNEPMGKGLLLSNNDFTEISKWDNSPPGSKINIATKLVCAKNLKN